jgi:NAD(P)H dehydrogenase (quinone)
MKSVLVTGATGRLGPHIVGALLAKDCRVRALTRDPGRAGEVLPGQADVVAGDLADPQALRGALRGISDLVLLTPHGPDMYDVQARLVDLAADVDVRVVKVSGTSSGIRPDGPDACRQHWLAEEHLRASGLPFAIVRPNAFMQTLLAGVAASVRQRGVVVNPLGSAGISIVDCADVGAATAEVVCNRRHDGSTAVLTGPAAPTYSEIAEEVETVTGRAVSVVDVTPQQAGEGARANGMSDWEAGHLAEMLAMFSTGASEYVTTDVQALTGRPPASAKDWIRRHADLFTQPAPALAATGAISATSKENS